MVAAHFPLPYAEIAADIVTGRIDAIETQAFAPGLDDPAVIEWYRFLDLGYRLPIVAGTDKMSAEVPVGAVRTYAHLAADAPLTFDTWADAVRAGRTFVTSGPILELSVDGHEPGGAIRMGGPGSLEVVVRARAAQAVIATLELVVGGRVVATATAATGSTELALHETVEVGAGTWIAARSRSEGRHPVGLHELDGGPHVAGLCRGPGSPARAVGPRYRRRRADHHRCSDLGRRACRDRRCRRAGADGRLLRAQPRDVPGARRPIRAGVILGRPQVRIRPDRRLATPESQAPPTGIAAGAPAQSSAIPA